MKTENKKRNIETAGMRVFTLLAVLLTMAAMAEPVDSLLSRAEYLFFNRHLAPGNLDSAYALIAECRQLEPENQQSLYLWSRIHVQKGDDARKKADRIRLYDRAKVIAESLKTLNPDNPDGWMWWAVAEGRIGQVRGVLNSLFMVPSLKQSFSRVLELDSGYVTAYDAFGVLYYELPGLFGGNLAKSEEFLVKGLHLDPNYTVLRLDLAKVYMRRKQWQKARDQLNLLIATPNPTFPADCAFDDRPEAQQLLRQIEGK